MGFFEMIRKTTILHRIMIVASFIWLLLMIDANWNCEWELGKTVCRFSIGHFASLGVIPPVAVWGLYWIIIEIVRKRKIK